MRWVLLAAAVLLAGCNVVVTPTPLFSASDHPAGAVPRPGVWRTEQKPDCAFDVAGPLANWPECAGGVALRDDGTAGYYDRASGKPVWKTQPLLFVPGTPMIGQAQVMVAGATFPISKPYAYVGVRPIRTDSAGRIVAMSIWPVQCGPPAPGDTLSMTKSLLPGLTAKPGDLACTTTDPAAIRAAAKASEPWAPETMRARWVWVREGENGPLTQGPLTQ
jgi:hypothetical protein